MSTGFEFSDVVEEAVGRSGGEEATAADVLKIRRGLRILTERWQAQGYNTWRITTMTDNPTGTTSPLVLPSAVDDVIQVNCQTSATAAESPMRRLSATEYAQLSSKDTTGQPSQYYLERTVPPKLYVYPIGTDAMILNIWYVARPEDYDLYGEDTDDVPGRWLEAMISGLALDLARKRPPYNEQLIARLKGEAAEAEDLAQRADRQRKNYVYRISMGS